MSYVLDAYYVHRYGGLYYALYNAIDSRDLTPVIVYRHVYPFESAIWTRPEAEWTPDRFTEITAAEAHELMRIDRKTLQAAIAALKKAQKA